jgi:hypothetical protein
MPKNNSHIRKEQRRKEAEHRRLYGENAIAAQDPTYRLLRAIFGAPAIDEEMYAEMMYERDILRLRGLILQASRG